jgi:DNA mismatch repair protein MutL
MAKIRVMPEVLANKIAAGEVVERPASAVKELVENSIDAEARHITVEVGEVGCRDIRVADDGVGMEEDDLILALERHATSKIERVEDLNTIQTLGFRGEALPSLAAVSRFEITSRTRASTGGACMHLVGGVVKQISQCGCPPGTQVCVRDLFFNQPARRKFLKKEKTESGHIADILTRMALGRPEIHFSLRFRNRQVQIWPGANSLEQRVEQIFPSGFSQSWLSLSHLQDCMTIEGYLSPPQLHRSNSRMLFLYVNGRAVRDHLLRYALLEAYRTLIPKGQFPVGVVFVELPSEHVDVNVHPTKAEVRFQNPRAVAQILTAAARSALSGMENLSRTRPLTRKAGVGDVHLPQQGNLLKSVGKPLRVAEARLQVYEASDYSPPTEPPVGEGSNGYAKRWAEGEATVFGDLNLIGQSHQAYILCEAKDGLILIDQHAAHERVFFEILRREATKGGLASQILMVPETVEVTAEEASWLEDSLALFAKLGYALDPFGTNTFVVRAVPAVALRQEPLKLLLELVAAGCEGIRSPEKETVLEHLLQSLACQMAVKAGQRLERDEMVALLEQLDGVDHAATCPHGRPLWRKLSLAELEKMFGRA